MREKLQRIQAEARKRIQESDGLDKLNEVRVAFLGKRRTDSCIKGYEGCSCRRKTKGWTVGQ